MAPDSGAVRRRICKIPFRLRVTVGALGYFAVEAIEWPLGVIGVIELECLPGAAGMTLGTLITEGPTM